MLRTVARGALPLWTQIRKAFVPVVAAGRAGVLLAGAACLLAAPLSNARSPVPSSPAQASVSLAELPVQGRETYRRIRAGGPFDHDKDGSVFGNRERQLPSNPRGYYREYTVETPGARNRGARRIVCGGAVRAPERCYYTADHYASFQEIVE